MHVIGFSYLTGRTQAIVADGHQSGFLEITKGLPQGSILGYILFTLYINEMGSLVSNSCIHYYADDTIIYSSAPFTDKVFTNLRSEFDAIQKALNKLKLVLNPEKTNYMLFTRSQIKNPLCFKSSMISGSNSKGLML